MSGYFIDHSHNFHVHTANQNMLHGLGPTYNIVPTKRFCVVGYQLQSRLPQINYAVYMDINCEYTRSIVSRLLRARPWCKLLDNVEQLNTAKADYYKSQEQNSTSSKPLFAIQISDFENISWENVMSGDCGASSYLVRKGLSRKAQLSLQLKRFISKNPGCKLSTAVPFTVVLETWNAFEEMKLDFGMGTFATFEDPSIRMAPLRQRLDWCLAEQKEIITTAEDTRCRDNSQQQQQQQQQQHQWILKPSVTNKGYNITVARDWEEVLDAIEKADEVREWVLQRYIAAPLLVMGGHKFHLRVYVLCIGALHVFVFDRILMLLAAHKYNADDFTDIYAHLTNTARAAEDVAFKEELFVKLLDDLPQYLTASHWCHCEGVSNAAQAVAHVKQQIHAVTAELFAAYENEYSIFCPMSQCFEVFGLDFMVDERLQVHFLEINPGPDFKQTGGRLHGVIAQLWQQVLKLTIDSGLLSAATTTATAAETVISTDTAAAVAAVISESLPADVTSAAGAADFTMVYSKQWSAAKHKGGFKFTDST